jgi:hypothetical protein
MTGAEWLVCRRPEAMLGELFSTGSGVSERRLRLFACACCRRIGDLVPLEETWAELLATAERCADGALSPAALDRIYQRAQDLARATAETRTEAARAIVREIVGALHSRLLAHHSTPPPRPPFWWAHAPKPSEPTIGTNAAAAHARSAADEVRSSWWRRLKAEVTGFPNDRVYEAERAAQADLLRDIFGNPFRVAFFSPLWCTETALALARTMYESRDFSPMPILADALQDAGCDNDSALTHCRDTTQVHVRGCWVVDLVLGRA